MSEHLRTQWQKHFDQWLQPFWETATPGLCFEVFQNGQSLFKYQGGESYRFYDLASLTKVLFTVPALMLAFQQERWKAESRMSDFLHWWPHPQTRVVDLLTHSSGLAWWKPFYQDLMKEPNVARRWDLLQQDIQRVPLVVSPKAVYSDVGFLSLAFLLKELFKDSLEGVWQEVKSEFAKDSKLHWIKSEEAMSSVSDYAPTEFCSWRGRLIQGEVHDENAWALGGVSTHAGLFGDTSDVSKIFLSYRAAYFDLNHPLHKTVRYFTHRQLPSERGDWALGFVLPTSGSSTSGQYFSPNSIGHTGFTGTSVWWDPERDLLIVILSNRVFYGREKREFAKLRPLLHDEIVSLIRRQERT